MNQAEERPDPIRHDWILDHEALIERFEAAWRSAGFPDLEDYLPPPDSTGRDELVLELVRVDMEFRAARGQPRSVIDYSGHLGILETLPLTDGDHFETIVPEPGGRIGRYELRGHLGRGAFATVHRAWDTELRREVAIKVPHGQILERPQLRERFLREARSVARLSHHAIVPIHEVGHTGKTAFIVYELMPGASLAALLEQIELTPEQAARWVERLCHALDHAHKHGIVHRDVKPGNVLMNQAGEPMLTDFGLATHSETDETLTQEGDLLGTPAYMSPEQAQGKGHAAGPTSDVYSLGVVLYELLTGARPFESSGVGVLYDVVYQEPLAPRERRAEIPGDLEVICLKAMAKEPDRRYPTAAAFGLDLRRWLERRPIEARRMSTVGRLALWCRRRPAQAATVAVALAAIVTVATVSFFRVVAERDRYREANSRSQENLYSALTSAARATTIAGETGWYWSSLDLLREANALDVESRDVAELRSLAMEVLGSDTPCFRLLTTCEGHEGPVRAVAASPDGKLAATASNDGTVRLWRIDSGALLAILEGHEGAVMAVEFAADGRRVVSAGLDGTLRVWDVDTHQALHVHDLGAPVQAVSVAPGGERLASGCEDGTLRIHLTAGAEAGSLLGTHAGAVTDLAWGPDGAQLASGGADGAMHLWDVETGDVIWTWTRPDSVRTLCFSPSGDRLAVSLSTWYGFTFVDRGGSLESAVRPQHQDSLLDLSWDERRGVLSASADGTLRLWNGLSERAVASGVPAAALAASFVPHQGRVIAGYADGALRVWQLIEPRAVIARLSEWNSVVFLHDTRQLVSLTRVTSIRADGEVERRSYAPSSVTALAIEPERRQLTVGGGDGNLRVVDLATREELARWRAHEGAVASVVTTRSGGGALASSDGSGAISLWDWSGERRGGIETGIGEVHELLSADGALFCAGSEGVEAWDLSGEPELRWRLPLGSAHRRVLAFRAGRLAFAPGDEGGLAIVDPASAADSIELADAGDTITSLAFSLDGSTLFTLDGAHMLRFQDPRTGEDQAAAQEVGVRGQVSGLVPWAGGRVMVVGTLSELRDPRAGLLARLSSSTDTAVAIDEPTESVLLGTATGAVRSVSRVGVEAELERERAADVQRSTPWLNSVATVADGGHFAQIWGVAASPDGRWVATAGHDEQVKLWRVPGMELTRTLLGHQELVWCVEFSPDSRLLASGGGGIRLWDVESGGQLAFLESGEHLETALSFHPSRPLLVSASLDGAIRLWQVEERRLLGVLDQQWEAVHDVEFSRDGRWLAAATHAGGVALWQVEDSSVPLAPGTPPDRVLEGPAGAVWAVAWSPDGQLLASASDRGEIVLWRGSTGERLATLQTTSTRIRSLAFSSDGGLLAYACYISTGRVWDLERLRAELGDLDLDW